MPEPALLQSRDELWAAIHAERAKLADDLAQLDDDQWPTPSLCGRWTVEQVVAHLTVAASTGGFRWFRSVLAARFDFDLHNDRRLAEHRGATRARPWTASAPRYRTPPRRLVTPLPGSAKLSFTPRTSDAPSTPTAPRP